MKARRGHIIEDERPRVVGLIYGDERIWRAIELVAEALLEQKSLAFSEVKVLARLAGVVEPAKLAGELEA